MEEFNYANLSENPTKDEIESEIKRLKHLKDFYDNQASAFKILINSMYGTIGYKNFTCYNENVAEAVTLQGQKQIKEMAHVIDNYFKKAWHKDKELHTAMGINHEKVKPIKENVVNYIDTDSNYVELDQVFKSTNINPDNTDEIDYIVTLYNNRLKGVIENKLKKLSNEFYVPYYNNRGKPYQVFEPEAYSVTGLWLAKKKYVLAPRWEPTGFDSDGSLNRNFEKLIKNPYDNLSSKGVELVRGETPKFVRDKIKEQLVYIFKNSKNFSINEFVKNISEIKKEYKLCDIEDIAITKSCNNYENWIINDTTALEIHKGTPIQLKAAAYYNYLLYNSKYKDKYQFILSGEKIKYYYIHTNVDTKLSSNAVNVFAYKVGDFPQEIAPKFDYDTMFRVTFLNTINRFIKVMGYSELSDSLVVFNSIF
jgi:DNA polymerase elongation subunit (family B)